MFGRFLIINKNKTKIIVKKNEQIHYSDIDKIQSNSPCPQYSGKDYKKVIDLVLNSEENIVYYLTQRGKIGMIELNLKQKSGLIPIPSHPHCDEAGSKDSTEGNYPRFSALQITPEDDYLAAVSIEQNEGIPTIRVWLLEIKPDADSIFPKIELVK